MSQDPYCETCGENVKASDWDKHIKTNVHLNRKFISDRIDEGDIIRID